MQLDFRTPSGFDRTRNVEIGNKNVKLTYLDEVFTTEHWLVRIYKYVLDGIKNSIEVKIHPVYYISRELLFLGGCK